MTWFAALSTATRGPHAEACRPTPSAPRATAAAHRSAPSAPPGPAAAIPWHTASAARCATVLGISHAPIPPPPSHAGGPLPSPDPS